MCYPTKCKTCNKTTWAGCGQHIDSVKAKVPANQWCTCPRETQQSKQTKQNTGGFFARLFG